MTRRIFISIFSLLLLCSFSAGAFAAPENSLGGVPLGSKYQDLQKKYSFLFPVKNLEDTTLPFPLSVLNKALYKVAIDPSLNMVIYVDKKTARIKALVTFPPTNMAPQEFETGAGLRVGDSIQTVRLLYGDPAKSSSYVYYFPAKTKVEERIHYYPNMCIYSSVKDAGEVVTSIVLGEYPLDKTLQEINRPVVSAPVSTNAAIKPPVNEPKQMSVTSNASAIEQSAFETEKAELKSSWKPWRTKVKPRLPEVSVEVSAAVAIATPQSKRSTKTIQATAVEPGSDPIQRPVRRTPAERVPQNVLTVEKVEVAQRVGEVSPEFLALIDQNQWRYRVRYNDKTQELVLTFRMTRPLLDELKATPEGAPYADVLETIFSQF